MDGREPSRTAKQVAGSRAAHQLIDNASVFMDPFARLILDAEALAAADEKAREPGSKPFRLFLAARSRFADDCIADEVEAGLRQVVVLGAGLDTFGLRNPYRDLGLKVFEVDHPATQTWKRERLAASNIALPSELSFVPVDFERDDLAEKLAASGFNKAEPALYISLGVAPYLERQTVFSLLRFVAGSTDTGIVFDYSEPLENYAPERRAHAEAMAARVAAAGEPWITLLDPIELSDELIRMGFRDVEDLDPTRMAERYFGVPAGGPDRGAGPHILYASTKTED
ncbi:class I SAM-dependent methyltransferase [Rhizobium sp. XQZ8]|uniref:class I SAM-dependent methyltransferase n=1 Tax=Rhizobium populisoli TaxID=2859785 RepID=UPI001C6750B2|nr:class I SAM-dependent methyltransferase [Rhizobium populisoli]MBW6423289.1 class I SAM-dependent methyltransferase [Rhizobium populisoli]